MTVRANVLLATIVALSLSTSLTAGAEMESLLVIEPGPENPRNSEGDIIELRDGRLCRRPTNRWFESTQSCGDVEREPPSRRMTHAVDHR